jgi:hypothetical protein
MEAGKTFRGMQQIGERERQREKALEERERERVRGLEERDEALVKIRGWGGLILTIG